MADLVLDFSDLYIKVSEFLGLGSSPTGTDLTIVKDLVYRGYRRFLYPMDAESKEIHTWSFLRRTDKIETEVNKYKYDLPTDFRGLVLGFKFNNGENKTNPKKITLSRLRALRNKSIVAGTPEYYAITNTNYDVVLDSNYQVIFYKTPDAVYSYQYEYIFEPEKPTGDDDVLVGGALGSEIILECALAEAELQEDDMASQAHSARVDRMIQTFIKYDKRYFPMSDEVDWNITLYIPQWRLGTQQ